jgi:LPXTG-motif cell wall-anchored protein
VALGRLVAALAAVLVVLAATGPGAAQAAPPTQDGPTAAQYATAWLAGQLDAGIPMQNFGSPDWGVTLDAALGMAAAGSGGAQIDAVWAALVADRDAAVAPGGIEAPGRLARAILLARAVGADPRAVGDAPGADLVERLEATRRTSGADTGLYGSTDPTYDGAFRQGYSIAALVAAGAAPDPTAVQWLLDQQCGAEADEGAWMAYRADPGVPCAFDGALFVGPDTNATAAAITGLLAAGQGADAVAAGLDWLDAVQEADGGWPQLVGFGTDPNSTALVLQALLAAGAADEARFADRSATPLQALLSFQLGCDALEADRGAFTFPGSNDAPNGFATAQAVAPAAGAPVLVAPGDPAPGVTPLDCTPETTTTTTPSTTAAPTTAAPTTAAPTTAGPSTTAAPTTAGLQPVVAGTSQERTTGTTSSLALTGASSDALVLVGLAAVALGAALLLAGRRRAHADAAS